MSDTDSTSESLRKFLESDDPSLVLMGLSMAKGVGVEEELLPLVLARALFSEEEEVRRSSESVFADHAPEELRNLPSALGVKDQGALNALDEVAPEFWRKILGELAADVRQGIAMLEECWDSQLMILAKDSNENVRRNVAKHANTPVSVLEVLAKDEAVSDGTVHGQGRWGVRWAVVANLNTPAALREMLEKDRNERAKKFYQLDEKLTELGWYVSWTTESEINHVYEDYFVHGALDGYDPDKMLVSYTGSTSDYMDHLEDVDDEDVERWYEDFEMAYLEQDLVAIENLTQSDLGKRLKPPTPEGWGEGWFVISVSEQGLQNFDELSRVIAECGCREGERGSDFYGDTHETIHIQW